MKTPIYSSLMGIFDVMGVPLSILMYIIGFSILLYFILGTFWVFLVTIALWFIAKIITKKDPYLIDLMIKSITENDIIGE